MDDIKLIFGNKLQDGIKHITNDYDVIFHDYSEPENIYFTLNESILSRHILLLGGSGSGKTNVFNLSLEQLRSKAKDKDIFIIFDTKGDFKNRFFKNGDFILGNGREYRDKSVSWNIFDEVLADGDNPVDYELNAREIAMDLFKDRGSVSQPFFANAARDIFAQILIYFIRRAKSDPKNRAKFLNNKNLVEFLLSADISRYKKVFTYYDDMQGLLSYVGDGTSNQALGVFAELKSMIYDCFNGIFADDDTKGRFSIRNAVRKKGGKAIFVEYDLAAGNTLTPIYRLLIDLALKEALGRGDDEMGNVFLVLDELKLLPKLQHLDDALNFGRSKGVKVMAGIQSINQLYEIYGETGGKVVAGGFSTLFVFHTSDNASREYVSSLFGCNVVGYQYSGIDRLVQKREREGYTVESWDQTGLKTGEAIVGLADEDVPFFFQFPMYIDRKGV